MDALRNRLLNEIETISAQKFDQVCMDIFRYQAKNNPLYAEFLRLLSRNPKDITYPHQIPFLPIGFFKTKTIKTGTWLSAEIFSSSGTTGMQQSLHHIFDPNFYLRNCLSAFEKFYASAADYAILALLPSYLEREGSSLIFMAEHFIKLSKQPQSGFLLHNTQELANKLSDCIKNNIPTLLLGVSYALLDFAETYPIPLGDKVVVMETGGMKGRRKELLREALHEILCTAFQVPTIHSEYGMTELLSQAYSKGAGIFYPADTLRILIRDSSDPLPVLPIGRAGAINLIDLANIDSCSFIASDDLGRLYADGSFEVLGRFDASEVRGCNLLVS